jgi:hypothetical protein
MPPYCLLRKVPTFDRSHHHQQRKGRCVGNGQWSCGSVAHSNARVLSSFARSPFPFDAMIDRHALSLRTEERRDKGDIMPTRVSAKKSRVYNIITIQQVLVIWYVTFTTGFIVN